MHHFIEKNSKVELSGHSIDYTIIHAIEPQKQIVMLHGAGESTKERCLPLARAMSKHGWTSLVFSFPGHGSSSGTLHGSTLSGRQQHAKEVIEQLGFSEAELLLGVSMGAHTSLGLINDGAVSPKQLVLIVPAFYAAEAQDVPFGPEFSQVLRKEKSYQTSPAFKQLVGYNGELFLMTSTDDPVIPKEIINKIRDIGKAKSRFVEVNIPNYGHQLTIWLSATEEKLQAAAQSITEMSSKPFEPFIKS